VSEWHKPRSRSDCKPLTPIWVRPLCNGVVREFGDFDGQRTRTEPWIKSSHLNGGLRITGEIEMALPDSLAVSTLPQVGGHDKVFWGWRLVLHGGCFVSLILSLPTCPNGIFSKTAKINFHKSALLFRKCDMASNRACCLRLLLWSLAKSSQPPKPHRILGHGHDGHCFFRPTVRP